MDKEYRFCYNGTKEMFINHCRYGSPDKKISDYPEGNFQIKNYIIIIYLRSFMRILITGAYGMLGSDLREVLKNFELICAGSEDLDITDEDKVMGFITEKSPDLVINAAAYTAVDDCETHYDEAYADKCSGKFGKLGRRSF